MSGWDHPKAVSPSEKSLPTPVGHKVIARVGELMLLGAVGQHGPDLGVTADGAFKDDVASIGRPGGIVVAPGFVGDLEVLLAGDIDDMNVDAAGIAGAVPSATTSDRVGV